MHAMRILFVQAVLLLAACGGGGGGGSGDGSGGGVVSSVPRLTLAQTAVVVSSDTSLLPPVPNVDFTVANMPTGGVYYQYGADGTAIESANVQLQGDGTGIIELNLLHASVLGAGTYTDHFRLEVCIDANCQTEIAGSPATITVTYTVTGNSNPSTTFFISAPSPISLQAHSTDAVGPSYEVPVSITDSPPTGLYSKLTEQPPGGAPTLTASLTYSVTGPSGGSISIVMKPPIALALGTYTENISFSLCFDAGCTRPLPGSPATMTLEYEIVATEGHDYVSRVLNGIGARYVAWDPHSQKLYATTYTGSTATVTQINPVTGALGTSATLPYDPAGLALSDDGQYAYVPLTYGSVVKRFHLPSLTPDVDITIPNQNQAGGVAVAPGSAHTIAVPLLGNGGAVGITVFDDAVARATTYTGGTGLADPAFDLRWGGGPTTLFALQMTNQQLHTLAVDVSGVTGVSIDQDTGLRGAMQFVNSLLYADSGVIFDPAAHTAAGTLFASAPAGSSRVTVDGGLGRAFVLSSLPDSGVVRINLANTTQTSRLLLPGVTTFANANAVRWGTDGLAFADYNGNLTILSGTFISQ